LFSSRRRHTRSKRDWSSDVCSSDLEIVAGRGSRIGAYYLLGVDLQDYEEIFEEKLELLKQLNENKRITWEGQFRPPLDDAEILPQPKNGSIPKIGRASCRERV